MIRTTFSWLLLLVIIPISACNPTVTLPDGTYYGYKSMCSLDLDNPTQEWFHEHILTIKGSQVSIDTFPGFIRDGEAVSSASDGAFFSYQGKLSTIQGRPVVALRLMSCDYCGVPVDDPLPSKKIYEFIIRPAPDRSFELDHVTYRLLPDARRHLGR